LAPLGGDILELSCEGEEMKTRVERAIAGRALQIETGELGRQADGAVLVRYGDAVVLATAVARQDTRGVPFLPLTVEYREKQYAAGQFPGGVIKREGRPTTKEVLTCRLIDRPIRPLFPEGYHEDIQIVAWVLSADEENDPDSLALVGASAALAISDIPFAGPVGACRISVQNDEFVVNPTYAQRDDTELDLVVCSTGRSVAMVEGSASSIPEDDLITAIQCAHDVNLDVIGLIEELVRRCGRPKREWQPVGRADAVREPVESRYGSRLREALAVQDKRDREAELDSLVAEAVAELCTSEAADAPGESEVAAAFAELSDRVMRRKVVRERVRLDGRAPGEVRPITCRVSCLPRTHGSAVFTRGETQALVVATLGTVRDEQRILDPLVEEEPKKFMLHYNFPPFSVGEVRPMRGPGRRDIGHGELAERALAAVLPDSDEFPYTIRVVADILESNGSSSMASVCGGTLCLMDAGVPIRNPVAGVAMGLVTQDGEAVVLTDIAGIEDHSGDMDLKIAGTQHGVTALQMDVKIQGVSMDILRRAFAQAREARLHILRQMLSVLSCPRDEISPYAPRLIRVSISPDSIGKLIGPGGKTIKALEESYGCNIDVQDDGTVTVSGKEAERAEAAANYISQLGMQVQVGAIYEGTVTELKDFGAIVELFPGADGLCHISQLDEGYVRDVRDFCKVGDRMPVKVLSVDGNSVRLSRKAALKGSADRS
jgi:polyribonucleotide nucleotidyltransferase